MIKNKEQRDSLMLSIVDLDTCVELVGMQNEIANAYQLVCDIEKQESVIRKGNPE